MAASALTPAVGIGVSGAPKPSTVWAVALAACAAAASSLALVLTSDAVGGEVGEPLVLALLSAWITVSYVLCGLIAWLRRPASRFGPLMIAAGFVSFLTDLSWTSSDVPFTIGQALDLLPPVLFLHVFLAYPSGRLRSSVRARSDRDGVRDRDRAPTRSDVIGRLRPAQPARGRFRPRGGLGAAACSARRGQRVLSVRSRHPRCSTPACGPAAAPLAGSAHRRIRARAGDDRLPPPLVRVRRSVRSQRSGGPPS